MSFLTLPEGLPRFSQAVMSFWCRVPTASLDAAYAAIDVGGETVTLGNNVSTVDYFIPPPFNGIIPLLTFGDPNISGYYAHNMWADLCSYSDEFLVYDITHGTYSQVLPSAKGVLGGYYPTVGPAIPLNPCYVGIDANGWNGTTAPLQINIQYPDVGRSLGIWWNLVGITSDPRRVHLYPTLGGVGGDGSPDAPILFTDIHADQVWCHPASAPFSVTQTWGDGTAVVARGKPESFTVHLADLTPDRWHHVLISFDLTGAVTAATGTTTVRGSAGSDCRMWAAVDDVDQDLADDVAIYAGLAPTLVLTTNAAATAITAGPVDFTLGPTCIHGGPGGVQYLYGYAYKEIDVGFAGGSYGYAPPAIPSDGFPLGIPATPQYLDNVYPCEMAEFQLWTGLTHDTSVVGNRRAFISAAGTPVPPNKKKTETDPQSGSIELLGKNPDILVTGSGNWISGRNTGVKTKLNDLGKPVESPADNFDATGLIVAYTPDPSLHGAQSPAAHATVR